NTRSGGGLRRGRHATKGARHNQKSQKPPKPQARVVRYGGPLFAFTMVFTLVLVVASHATTMTGGLRAGTNPTAVQPDAAVSGEASHAPQAPALDSAYSSTGSHPHITTA